MKITMPAGAVFAIALATFALPAIADPALDQMPPDSGTYACVGHDNTKYDETITRPFGNDVVRYVDSGDGKFYAEHTVGLDPVGHKWYAVTFSEGKYETLTSPDAMLYGTTWTGMAPDMTPQSIMFTKMPAGYQIDIHGTDHGKPYSVSNVCTK